MVCYSVENTTQACPTTDVFWSTAMMEHSNDEMDVQMDMREYRSSLAQYMRHSPENATQKADWECINAIPGLVYS